MEVSLRKEILKLAHAQPELRSHLLPLLRTGGLKTAGLEFTRLATGNYRSQTSTLSLQLRVVVAGAGVVETLLSESDKLRVAMEDIGKNLVFLSDEFDPAEDWDWDINTPVVFGTSHSVLLTSIDVHCPASEDFRTPDTWTRFAKTVQGLLSKHHFRLERHITIT